MKRLLTESDCKELLDVSSDLMDRFRRFSEEPIPFMRIGGTYRYDEEKVLAWAESESYRDPHRKLRNKFRWERRPRTVVVGASSSSNED